MPMPRRFVCIDFGLCAMPVLVVGRTEPDAGWEVLAVFRCSLGKPGADQSPSD